MADPHRPGLHQLTLPVFNSSPETPRAPPPALAPSAYSTEPPRYPQPPADYQKLTRGHSCVLCQQRKVRCDKQKPCANCIKANVECRVVPSQPPRRRRKKGPGPALVERLRKYESLLMQHGVEFEPADASEVKAYRENDNVDDVADLENDMSGLRTSPSSTADQGSPDLGHEKQKWAYFSKEYRATDDVMQDSSGEEFEGPTLHHAFDTMFENNDGFPFVVGGTIQSVTSAHPPAAATLQLWQYYISNVNPLLKISHISTLQPQIIKAMANTPNISRPLEALMFSIYFVAVTSLPDEEVLTTFGEEKNVLLKRFHAATTQALINAGFMRSTELSVLQALMLYLLCIRPFVDPRNMFCLIGIAVRIATRLGIHRDSTHHGGVTPFEAEMRRRLWWQIVIFDKRTAEIIGSRETALSTCGGDCKLPLNINDTDLNIHAKDPPIASRAATEMMFCLTRIELITSAMPRHAAATRAGGDNTGGASKPNVQYSPGPSSPDVVTHMAHQGLPNDLAAFCQRIESEYLQHCDSKIPLHFFTLLMTRQAMCKLHVIGFLSKGIPSESLDQDERDSLFITAIEMVEYDNIIQTTAEISCFRWYTYHHFPFPAYILLVSELRHRTTGDLCERAWSAMIENHERRGLTRNLRSPMHIAFGHFFIKAWDARAAAEAQMGNMLQTPRIVTLLRTTMSRWRRPNHPNEDASGGSQPGHTPGPAGHGGFGTGTSVGGSSSAATPGMYSEKSPGMYSHKSPGVVDVSPQMSHAGGPPMAMDDSMMFGSYDGLMPFNAFGQSLQDADFSQINWLQMMQYQTFNDLPPSQMYMQPGPSADAGPQ